MARARLADAWVGQQRKMIGELRDGRAIGPPRWPGGSLSGIDRADRQDRSAEASTRIRARPSSRDVK